VQLSGGALNLAGCESFEHGFLDSLNMEVLGLWRPHHQAHTNRRQHNTKNGHERDGFAK
jgi:hypothetical protein